MNRIKFADKHGQKQRHYYTRASSCATQRGIVTPFAPGTVEFSPPGDNPPTEHHQHHHHPQNCCILTSDSLWLINILRFAYLSAALHWRVILYRAIAMVGAKSQLRVQKYTDNSGTRGPVIYKRASFCRKWQR